MRNRNHIYMTSEGFSFHTIELKKIYSSKRQYTEAFTSLKKLSDHNEFYPLKEFGDGRYFCGHFSDHGIRIYLSEKTRTEKDKLYLIKAVINPRKLIDPDCDYLGIMPSDEKSLDRMEEQFTEIMRKARLPEFIDEWSLTRIDLCVNFIFNRKKLPQQIIQLISRGPVPRSYKRDTYTIPTHADPTGKIHLEKHSVKLWNKRIALVAYDKAYQMKKEGLPWTSEFGMKKRGILRVELQCHRDWISEQADKHKCQTVREKLDYFSAHSQAYLCDYVNRLYLGGDYFRYDLLRSKIEAADSVKGKSKKRMLDFSNLLASCNDFEAAFQIISESLTEKQVESMVKHFSELNIVPIPLPKKCKLKAIQSLPAILNEMDDCAFTKRFNPKKRYVFPLKCNICIE